MIQDGSVVKVVDNSGAKIAKDFKVLGSSKRRYAELGDIVQDRGAESPFETAATALLPDEIAVLLSPLDEREREILKLRFGLDRGEARTLEEVGEEFNVTRERNRQIEANALKKKREKDYERILIDYVK